MFRMQVFSVHFSVFSLGGRTPKTLFLIPNHFPSVARRQRRGADEQQQHRARLRHRRRPAGQWCAQPAQILALPPSPDWKSEPPTLSMLLTAGVLANEIDSLVSGDAATISPPRQ